ncbi:unnamed protein product [Ilex paraguariensis]|uniref:Uncharacterized protein n=1 Tax=Ilex paraguariensis TaxID=185542 RepID=A0ABC8V0U9_9AQUA
MEVENLMVVATITQLVEVTIRNHILLELHDQSKDIKGPGWVSGLRPSMSLMRGGGSGLLVSGSGLGLTAKGVKELLIIDQKGSGMAVVAEGSAEVSGVERL